MKKNYLLLAGLLFATSVVVAQDYTPGDGDGLQGSYWKGATNFDEEESSIFWSKRPQGTVAEKIFDRVDKTIDFDWGNGNPFDDTDDDFSFCIEWNGYLLAPVTSYYTFDFTYWDDGYYFALYDLDNLETPMITSEFWGTDFGWDRPEWTCDGELEGGKYYKIVIRYYENEFGAHARFSWFIDEASVMTEVVPQSQLYTQLDASAVEGIQSTGATVKAGNGYVELSNMNDDEVSIYNTMGQCVYASSHVTGTVTVDLKAGLYIVDAGKCVKKVMVR